MQKQTLDEKKITAILNSNFRSLLSMLRVFPNLWNAWMLSFQKILLELPEHQANLNISVVTLTASKSNMRSLEIMAVAKLLHMNCKLVSGEQMIGSSVEVTNFA